MALTKILDDRKFEKEAAPACMMGSSDCMYLTSNGGCSAEYCIFGHPFMPKITSSGRTLTCSVCGSATKTFSPMSGVSSFICGSCAEKIKKVIDNPTCPICGAGIELGQGICSSCASRIREKLNE